MIDNRRVNVLLLAASLAISLVLTLLPMPGPIAPAQPAFYVMTVMFWTARQPLRFGLIAAWVCGLPLDILYGTPFFEHGLAMAVAAYAVIKTRGPLCSGSILAQAPLMLAVFGLYEFVLFWIDGVAGLDADPWWRWLPAASSAALWPLWAWVVEQIADIGAGKDRARG